MTNENKKKIDLDGGKNSKTIVEAMSDDDLLLELITLEGRSVAYAIRIFKELLIRINIQHLKLISTDDRLPFPKPPNEP
jgi:hypothetical protein